MIQALLLHEDGCVRRPRVASGLGGVRHFYASLVLKETQYSKTGNEQSPVKHTASDVVRGDRNREELKDGWLLHSHLYINAEFATDLSSDWVGPS
jgi:hypothetical protein